MTALEGAILSRTEPVDWLDGDGLPLVATGSGLGWYLGYFTDGLVWGICAGQGEWRFSHKCVPNHSGTPGMAQLLEARMFGAERELYFWRSGASNDLAGRSLQDAADAVAEEARPADATLMLLGDRKIAGNEEFSVLAEANGRRVVVPFAVADEYLEPGHWPGRLHVRQYFETSDTYGAVRVGATRFVDVSLVKPKGGKR